MAFSILYRKLFQLHWLYGYALGGFDPLLPPEQKGAADWSKYDAGHFLDIRPTDRTRRFMQGHRMRMINTPKGFFVALEVKAFSDAGQVRYRPFIPLTAPFRLDFILSERSPGNANISNVRLMPNVAAKYYFDNFSQVSEKRPPFLSLHPDTYQAGRIFEMGEWVRVDQEGGASSLLYQAREHIPLNQAPQNAPARWRAYPGQTGMSGYHDRLLMGHTLIYRLGKEAGTIINQARCQLLDEDGNVAKEWPFTGDDLSNLSMDAAEVESGWYTLQVTAANGYTDRKRVLLDHDLYRQANWGLLSIGHTEEQGELALLEADGSLRRVGPEAAAPRFNVFLPARATYWRYHLHPKQDLTKIADDQYLLDEALRRMTYKEPVPSSVKRIGLEVKTAAGERKRLPDPESLMVKPGADRFYSDIYPPLLNF